MRRQNLIRDLERAISPMNAEEQLREPAALKRALNGLALPKRAGTALVDVPQPNNRLGPAGHQPRASPSSCAPRRGLRIDADGGVPARERVPANFGEAEPREFSMEARPSLDHFVRENQQRRWNREPECRRRLEVDGEKELFRLFDRQVARHCPLQDAIEPSSGRRTRFGGVFRFGGATGINESTAGRFVATARVRCRLSGCHAISRPSVGGRVHRASCRGALAP